MGGGAGLDRGVKAAQRAHIRLILRRRAGREIGDRDSAVGRALDDLVVDVGDVADIGDMTRAIDRAQQPEQRVEHDDRPGVADMGLVIDRRTADIEPDIRAIERDERNAAAPHRVGKCQIDHQAASPARRLAARSRPISGSNLRMSGPWSSAVSAFLSGI
jgi:hypothetical protein